MSCKRVKATLSCVTGEKDELTEGVRKRRVSPRLEEVPAPKENSSC